MWLKSPLSVTEGGGGSVKSQISVTSFMKAPIPVQKLFEWSPVRESGPPDPDVFFEPEIFDLMLDPFLFPVSSSFRLVRFDAANVVRGAGHQRLH